MHVRDVTGNTALPYVVLKRFMDTSFGKKKERRSTGNLNKRKSGMYTLKCKRDNNTWKLVLQFCKTLSKRPSWHHQNKRRHFLLQGVYRGCSIGQKNLTRMKSLFIFHLQQHSFMYFNINSFMILITSPSSTLAFMDIYITSTSNNFCE